MALYGNKGKYLTEKGDWVQSKYEKAVANFLYENDISYEYDKPYHFLDGEIAHPDFRLIDYDVFIEVWGMTGDPLYYESKKLKQEKYRKDGTKLIELFPKGGRLNFKYLIWVKFKELTGKVLPTKTKWSYYPPENFPIREYD